MSYALTCEIEIGKYIFKNVTECRIESSRKTLGDRATITLPHKFHNDYLSKVIKAKDTVVIRLGYNGNLTTEFTGYVSEVQPGRPVVISCEDEIYNLKRSKPAAKSFESIKLESLLKYMVPGIQTECPDITLSPFYVKSGVTTAKALEQLKDVYGLDIYFRNGKLFAGLAYSEQAIVNLPAINYDLDLNVLPESSLTFKTADSVRLKVKAISVLPNNTTIETEVGDDDGSSTTLHFYNVQTKEELKRQATEKLKSMKFDGFSGSMTTLDIPFAQHTMIVNLRDQRDGNSRTGRYFIDTVVTTFGQGGFRRELTLGRRAG